MILRRLTVTYPLWESFHTIDFGIFIFPSYRFPRIEQNSASTPHLFLGGLLKVPFQTEISRIIVGSITAVESSVIYEFPEGTRVISFYGKCRCLDSKWGTRERGNFWTNRDELFSSLWEGMLLIAIMMIVIMQGIHSDCCMIYYYWQLTHFIFPCSQLLFSLLYYPAKVMDGAMTCSRVAIYCFFKRQ